MLKICWIYFLYDIRGRNALIVNKMKKMIEVLVKISLYKTGR